MNTETTTTALAIAREIAESFTTDERHDGAEFTKLRDDAPAWLKSDNAKGACFMLRVHAAVDDRMPDGWIYEHTRRIAQGLTDYDAEAVDAMRELDHEICDGLVDVYNADLTRWLASHLGNVALCDEASEEFGDGKSADLIAMIRAGQYLALSRIFGALLTEIENELANRL